MGDDTEPGDGDERQSADPGQNAADEQADAGRSESGDHGASAGASGDPSTAKGGQPTAAGDAGEQSTPADGGDGTGTESTPSAREAGNPNDTPGPPGDVAGGGQGGRRPPADGRQGADSGPGPGQGVEGTAGSQQGGEPRGQGGGQPGGQQGGEPRGQGGGQQGSPPGPQAEEQGEPGAGAGPDAEAGDEEPPDDSWWSRRRALGAVGAVGLGALGYTVLSIWNEPRAPEPDLPSATMEGNGWVRRAQRKEPVSETNLGPISITALGNTVNFGNEGLREVALSSEVVLEAPGLSLPPRPLRDVAQDAFQEDLAIFVATRIDLGPDLDNMPLGIGRAEVMGNVTGNARTSFVQTMEDSGLENVRETETGTLDIDSGETADLYQYAGEYQVAGGTFTEQGVDFTIPDSSVSMTGYLAVWHHRDWIMIGAGAHPAENYQRSFEEDLSTGGTATITVDLGLTPADYREEMLGYMRAME